MGRRDFQIISTIVIFCACVFGIWKLIQIPIVYDYVEDFVYSNRFYARKIKIKTYFTTSDQVSEVFKSPDQPFDLSQKMDNPDLPLYFVIRLENFGDRRAWGILSCQMPDNGRKHEVVIIRLVDEIGNYVIPTCYTTSNLPSSKPKIKWKSLYTNK